MKFPKIDKKKAELVSVIALGVVFLLLILFTAGVFKKPLTVKPYDTGGANITSAIDAHAAANVLAKQWHADAVLSSLTSNPVDTGQTISDWKFIFIAKSAPGKGFSVEVSNSQVVSYGEIKYVGSGAALPDTIISQGEAIRRVEAMKGYTNQPILGIQAVYDPVKKVWFWAVKTPIGIVSVDANQ